MALTVVADTFERADVNTRVVLRFFVGGDGAGAGIFVDVSVAMDGQKLGVCSWADNAAQGTMAKRGLRSRRSGATSATNF